MPSCLAKPRRCSLQRPEPDRRLQDECAKWAGPYYNNGVCGASSFVLGLSNDARDVYTLIYVKKKKNRNALTSVYASFYQEYLSKDLTEKYGALNAEMEKVIHEANTEISSLQNRLSGLYLYPTYIFLRITCLTTEKRCS